MSDRCAMFKYRFWVNNKNRIQKEISDRMCKQETYVKGAFGIPLYRKGLVFTENTEIIEGFYIERSEWEYVKTTPFRTYFRGRYIALQDCETVDVWVYPSIFEVFIVVLMVLEYIWFGNVMSAIIAVVVVAILLISFIRTAKNMHEELNRIFLDY